MTAARRRPELMAPVASRAMLEAAAQGGADAVYFAAGAFNMRRGVRSFDRNQLPSVVGRAHELGLRAFVTLNTLIFDDELDRLATVLDDVTAAGADAVIAWDPSVVALARERGLEIHLSTQASVANAAAARFWAAQGVTRIVLARELSLEQVAALRRAVEVQIEVFVHGALCLAVSGRCLLSQYLTGLSGNRGRCVQPCRRTYEIRDTETGDRMQVDDRYVLSPRDLCAVGFVDLLIAAGVDAFKIEGRNRSPEYVREVTACYRAASEAALEGRLDADLIVEFRSRMARVYNRGFSDGFYFGMPAGDGWAGRTGTAATHRKVYVGRVVNYYARARAAEVALEGASLSQGDDLVVVGRTTGVVNQRVASLQIEREAVASAPRSVRVALRTDVPWRRGDKVFRFEPVVS